MQLLQHINWISLNLSYLLVTMLLSYKDTQSYHCCRLIKLFIKVKFLLTFHSFIKIMVIFITGNPQLIILLILCQLIPYYMFAFYHVKICILLWQFDQTIFEGIIALFDLNNIMQKFVCSTPPTS